jgi:hypothetical protein
VAQVVVVDDDLSYLFDCIRWYHMIIVCLTFISLCRPGTIGQDEVEESFFTGFLVVFKAHELINRPRLEPLLKDRGFIEKLKQGSAFWILANNL